MSKIFITVNGKMDCLVVPNVMATKLTRYYWMVVNQSLLPEWAIPPRPMKMPIFPNDSSEKEIMQIVSKTFGKIIAEREEGIHDQGWVALIPDEWQQLIERHGIPD